MQTDDVEAAELVEDVAGKPLPGHRLPEDAVEWRTNLPRPHPGENHPMLIVVMGVSGCGKSTIGRALADSLDMPYLEGDDLHPKSNVDKMSSGTPLNDADREPWLEIVRTTAEHICAEQDADPNYQHRRGVVVTCSSLKKYYREILRGTLKPHKVPEHMDPPHPHILPTYFVFIKGDRELLMERMNHRVGHFMKSQMLDSQLETLESPDESGEEGVIVVRMEDSVDEQVKDARDGLARIAGSL